MWMTCPIFGRFCASGSTQWRATRIILFSALGHGFSGILGSTTCSDFLSPTMVFSHSTKVTWERQCKFTCSLFLSSLRNHFFKQKKTDLSRRSWIINRRSSWYDFHDKYSEAVNITSFIQHSSASIFWSDIPVKNREDKLWDSLIKVNSRSAVW